MSFQDDMQQEAHDDFAGSRQGTSDSPAGTSGGGQAFSPSLDIRIYDDADRLNRDAADIVCEAVVSAIHPVLGFCTGMTPVGLYRELIRRYSAGELSFADAAACGLDEYIGLPPSDPNSFHAFMREQLLDHANLPMEQFHLPAGTAADSEAECRRFDGVLGRIGRRHLHILGIGRNGHIGFNEPADALPYGTRLVGLSEETMRANAVYFDPPKRIPHSAITMGIGSILDSDHLLLIAFGKEKAAAVAKALTGPITTQMPGSLLQLHPRVTVMLDREAGRGLADRLQDDPAAGANIRLNIY
ncbi:glucosamine-6-phosphate deaminase [Paenibacillus pinihumi]|uniref:glucosamine-6-phosphate deaminase n=1 Tax=Paenibacillus pinihumi TaxID=669462 RepID=UPI0004022CE5|nr:glucosamine-6-phosphate deaminase [Paenibacillus pinihumi]